MTYLLDTDTCIYWLTNRYSVREKVRQVGWNQISICIITAAELYFGAFNPNRVEENFTRAEFFIEQLPVLPLTVSEQKAHPLLGAVGTRIMREVQPHRIFAHECDAHARCSQGFCVPVAELSFVDLTIPHG